MLRTAMEKTPFAQGTAAGEPAGGWIAWDSLTQEDRDNFWFRSNAALADAIRRVAREIDESRGAVSDDGDD
jgi:hypothetical protein